MSRFYTTELHSTHLYIIVSLFCAHNNRRAFLISGSLIVPCIGSKERKGNVLFNDALNTFYLWLYGIRHIVKDHSDRLHWLRFPINSKGSFILELMQNIERVYLLGLYCKMFGVLHSTSKHFRQVLIFPL